MHRWLRHGDVATELRLVDELPEAQARGAHEPAKIGQPRDRGEILQVPLQIRPDVAVEPNRPLLGRGEPHGRGWETTAPRQRAPVFTIVRLRREKVQPLRPARIDSQPLPPAYLMSWMKL